MALVQSLQVPDREGKYADVVLGKAAIEDYVTPRSSPYFGAVIGRFAGRIRDGKFTLGNKEYVRAFVHGRRGRAGDVVEKVGRS